MTATKTDQWGNAQMIFSGSVCHAISIVINRSCCGEQRRASVRINAAHSVFDEFSLRSGRDCEWRLCPSVNIALLELKRAQLYQYQRLCITTCLCQQMIWHGSSTKGSTQNHCHQIFKHLHTLKSDKREQNTSTRRNISSIS